MSAMSRQTRVAGSLAAALSRMPVKETEAQFQNRVIHLAHLNGWRCFHARPARTEKGWRTAGQGNGASGFFDLVLARDGVVILAELKSEQGRVSAAQRRWMIEAGGVARLWRPRDWDSIVEELRRERNA